RHLERVRRIEVPGRGPAGGAARRQHGGVLAGTVHVHALGTAAGAEYVGPGTRGEREVGRAAEDVLAEPGGTEHRAYPRDVHRLATVTRGREGEFGGTGE